MRIGRLALALVLASLALAPVAQADPGPDLTVDAALTSPFTISPYIYGWNYAPPDVAAAIGLPVNRQGGNSADTLNWQTGTHNTSSDYFFENLPWCWSNCDPGAAQTPWRAYTDQIYADRAVGARSLLDVPMLGYVAADVSPYAQPLPCSFTKTNFATQNAFDPYDTECGDGHPPGDPNSWVTNTKQLSTAVADSPATEADWVDDLKTRYGSAANGGVALYELGNEPALWNYTHHDWHPQPTTATELRDDMLALAEAIKDRDPTASVIGPAEWGWINYFCSAADGGCGPDGPAPDPNSDWTKVQDGKGLMEWLLQEFKAYADAHDGRRLLDYIDVHYYRQDSPRTTSMDVTRSLWDPTYTDPSWINDQIDLIPRMRSWTDAYPGTKTSLSEYDLAIDEGDDDTHVSEDNLLEADALGIFGREGLDLATLWPETNLSHYIDAFKLYRNYDGNGSRFGDGHIIAYSSDQSQLAIYGASRGGSALTLVIINKSTNDLTSTLSLSSFHPAPSAQVWQFTDVSTGIRRGADQPVSDSGFTATFPARSMSMVVIPKGDTSVPCADCAALAAGAAGAQPQQPPPPPVSTPAVVRCKVPSLAGLTLTKARAKLKKAHCRLGKVTKKRSRVRKGRVIAQKPKRGAVRRKGARVGVVLSRGR
jgi:hypothetical protein